MNSERNPRTKSRPINGNVIAMTVSNERSSSDSIEGTPQITADAEASISHICFRPLA